MAEARISFRGQGFSLPRGKNRFVLPAQLRKTIKDTSGKNVVCLIKHNSWTCVQAFGLAQAGALEAEIERALAENRITELEADLRFAQLSIMSEVPFDESGRFVMPAHLIDSAKLGEQLFFNGMRNSFLIWNPDELYRMGEGWEAIQAACRDEVLRNGSGK